MNTDRDIGAIRLCLNHSQSRLDQSIALLEELFRQWSKHPTSRHLHQKLLSEFSDFEWMLSEHFQWLTADLSEQQLARSLGQATSFGASLFDWQIALLEQTASLKRSLMEAECKSSSVQRLEEEFCELREAIAREENEERCLFE